MSADEGRLRRASSASTYALEPGDAGFDDGDAGGSGGGGGGGGLPDHGEIPVAAAAGVNVDYLDAMIDDDDEYVSPSRAGGGAGGGTVITKTFKAPEDEHMRTFMKQKDSVLGDLDTIQAKAEEVRRITRQLDGVYVEEETKKLQSQLHEHIKAGDGRSMRAKKKLNQLKKSTRSLKASASTNARIQSQLQIRHSLQQTLEMRFVEVTRDLQEAKGAYQLRLRENITRQVKIADPQATDEDIADAIEAGNATELIQRALNRSSLGHAAFQDKAADVAEKSKDIKELEQSMLKLKEMFQDLAQLIEMQSEQLDVIEVTVDEAGSNVDAGNKELEGVVEEQTAIRKRITILLVVVGVCVVGGAIAAVVLLT